MEAVESEQEGSAIELASAMDMGSAIVTASDPEVPLVRADGDLTEEGLALQEEGMVLEEEEPPATAETAAQTAPVATSPFQPP